MFMKIFIKELNTQQVKVHHSWIYIEEGIKLSLFMNIYLEICIYIVTVINQLDMLGKWMTLKILLKRL